MTVALAAGCRDASGADARHRRRGARRRARRRTRPPRLPRRLAVPPRRAARAGRLAERCSRSRCARSAPRGPRLPSAPRRSSPSRSRSCSSTSRCARRSSSARVAIVAGGILLAAERDRPGHLRARGLAVRRRRGDALRDARQHRPGAARPRLAARPRRPRRCWRAPSWRRSGRGARRRGASCGGSRRPASCSGSPTSASSRPTGAGRVTVVSPLVATESLWGVGLAALLLRHTEGMGRRLALGALLVVVGGAVIGAAR